MCEESRKWCSYWRVTRHVERQAWGKVFWYDTPGEWTPDLPLPWRRFYQHQDHKPGFKPTSINHLMNTHSEKVTWFYALATMAAFRQGKRTPRTNIKNRLFTKTNNWLPRINKTPHKPNKLFLGIMNILGYFYETTAKKPIPKQSWSLAFFVQLSSTWPQWQTLLF